MKRILYLHGFASSGASGTVELLRREFWERTDPAHRAVVTAPDIPVDPLEAWPMLEALAYDEMPDLIVGTSMGAWYAQQLHGFLRICVNPSFWLSKKYDILHVGKHKWLNRRKDGATEFHVKKETIEHFQEMEEHQFDGVTDDDRTLAQPQSSAARIKDIANFMTTSGRWPTPCPTPSWASTAAGSPCTPAS